MTAKLKIMHVNYTMNIGGIESFIMNIARTTDFNKNELVILTYSNQHFDYEAELKDIGVMVVRISNPKLISTARHLSELIYIMKSIQPDVVHAHTYFDSAFVLLAAKIAGVQKRISHSHTALANTEGRIYKKAKWVLARLIFRFTATVRIACSNEAGVALFGGQRFVTVFNGIDLSNFRFNKSDRSRLRLELGLQDDIFIIGHVGRFDTPKNHLFLIEIFKEYVATHPDSKLVLVGSGKLEDKIRMKIKESGVEEKVLLLGDRKDVPSLLNVFDYFVFPSIYEGLPVSLIEVQANGLHALVSDAVSPEAKVSECVEFLPLDLGSKVWAERIDSSSSRFDISKSRRLQAYNITSTLAALQAIYEGGK